MPAAKKSTAHHKAKPGSKSKTKAAPHRNDLAEANKPVEQPIRSQPRPNTSQLPTTPGLTMPMPVPPGRIQGQSVTPLIRTTYNSIWLKRLGILAGIGVITGLSYAGWLLRDRLPRLSIVSNNNSVAPVTQLSISPTPSPNPSKLHRLSTELTVQSSSSASPGIPVDQASSSAQLVQNIQSQDTASLKQELNESIASLDQQQINTNNLKAYREKIADLEAKGLNEQARQWLVEAVLHAHEITALQSYYE